MANVGGTSGSDSIGDKAGDDRAFGGSGDDQLRGKTDSDLFSVEFSRSVRILDFRGGFDLIAFRGAMQRSAIGRIRVGDDMPASVGNRGVIVQNVLPGELTAEDRDFGFFGLARVLPPTGRGDAPAPH